MISKIDLCRDIALDVLKPSKRDLEHGLEISTICSTYMPLKEAGANSLV